MDEFFDPYSLVQQQIQNNNEWSAQQAQKQMDFQREMSDTAHQREVADLKAAGLNPVLSAHTQGASTPSGAMGTTDHSGTQALVDLMSQMISADTAKTIAGYGGAGYGGGSYGYTVKGNYRTGTLGQIAQDFLAGLLGESPREFVNGLGKDSQDILKDLGVDLNGFLHGDLSVKEFVSQAGQVLTSVVNSYNGHSGKQLSIPEPDRDAPVLPLVDKTKGGYTPPSYSNSKWYRKTKDFLYWINGQARSAKYVPTGRSYSNTSKGRIYKYPAEPLYGNLKF